MFKSWLLITTSEIRSEDRNKKFVISALNSLKDKKSKIFVDELDINDISADVLSSYRYISFHYENDSELLTARDFISKYAKLLKDKNIRIVGFLHDVQILAKDFNLFDSLLDQVVSCVAKIKSYSKELKINYVDTKEKLLDLETLLKGKVFAYDTETSSLGSSDTLYQHGGRILCITFSCSETEGYFLPLYINDSPFSGLEDFVLEVITRILQEPTSKSIAHNSKFDRNWLKYVHGVTVTNQYLDTMLMWYAIRENINWGCGLKEIVDRLYGFGGYEDELKNWMIAQETTKVKREKKQKVDGKSVVVLDALGNPVIEEVQKKIRVIDSKTGKKVYYKVRWGDIPLTIMLRYAVLDAILTYKIYADMQAYIDSSPRKADFNKFLFEYSMPAAQLLHEIEVDGIAYDEDKRKLLESLMEKKLFAFKQKIIMELNLTRDILLNFYNERKFLPYVKKLNTLLKRDKSGNISDLIFQPQSDVCASTRIAFKLQGVETSLTSLKDILLFLIKYSDYNLKSRDICDEILLLVDPEKFEIDSTLNLRWILYTYLNLPVKERTEKTNEPSISKSALVDLAKQSKACALLADRNLLKTTYGMFIKDYGENLGSDFRIHASFNQSSVKTARLSSSNPNHQQLVASQDYKFLQSGVKLLFIPDTEDNVLISADYSQLELRVLAAFADETNMISAFQADVDIHRWVASQLYGKPEDEISDYERKIAKQGSFATVYGASAKSIAESRGLTLKEVEDFLKLYFKKFPKIVKYTNDQFDFAKKHGYVKNPYGFYRYIPEAASFDRGIANKGKRNAVNTPIQGYASIINVIAASKIQKRFEQDKVKIRARILVHDAIVVDVPKSLIQYCHVVMKSIMEEPREAMRGCPLKADFEIGNSYGLQTKFEDYLKDPSLLDKSMEEFWKYHIDN